MRQVLPVVGAIVGAYFGGAQGAQIGWAIGSIVGNAVDPLVIKAPSIGDLAQQTSQEGVPRPIFFALSQPVAGNIVFCSKPDIETKDTQQGKGGGPVTQSNVIYRTYAIAVGEGPITGFIRVWKNGKLVYDARPQGDPSNNASFFKTSIFYLGGFDQLPDPHIESIVGVANAPAMRGTAYLLRYHDDLTNVSGAVPQFVFQVLRCEGMLLTSRPYAVETVESVTTGLDVTRVKLLPQPYINEQIAPNLEMLSVTRFGSEDTYAAPSEDWIATDLELLEITRFGSQAEYDAPNEDQIATDLELLEITRFGSQVSYSMLPDELATDLELLSITRTTP